MKKKVAIKIWPLYILYSAGGTKHTLHLGS